MFDLEILWIFIVVVEIGSFLKVVERLCKIMVTISYCIKFLEENIGVVLFFCMICSVMLTVVGEYLFF